MARRSLSPPTSQPRAVGACAVPRRSSPDGKGWLRNDLGVVKRLKRIKYKPSLGQDTLLFVPQAFLTEIYREYSKIFTKVHRFTYV